MRNIYCVCVCVHLPAVLCVCVCVCTCVSAYMHPLTISHTLHIPRNSVFCRLSLQETQNNQAFLGDNVASFVERSNAIARSYFYEQLAQQRTEKGMKKGPTIWIKQTDSELMVLDFSFFGYDKRRELTFEDFRLEKSFEDG